MDEEIIESREEAEFVAEQSAFLKKARLERGSCPEAGELLAFVAGELGTEARKAVAGHLELCPDCHDLVSIATATSTEVDDVTWARVSRGLDRRLDDAPWRRSPKRWRNISSWAAGIAAALIVVIGAPIAVDRLRQEQARSSDPVATERGVALMVREPQGRIDRLERFSWTSPPAALTFRIEVRDENAEAWSGEIGPSPATPPAGLLEVLERNRIYRWRVAGVDRDGREIVSSNWAEFMLEGP